MKVSLRNENSEERAKEVSVSSEPRVDLGESHLDRKKRQHVKMGLFKRARFISITHLVSSNTVPTTAIVVSHQVPEIQVSIHLLQLEFLIMILSTRSSNSK